MSKFTHLAFVCFLAFFSAAFAQEPTSGQTERASSSNQEKLSAQSDPPELEAYLKFRRWINAQPEGNTPRGEMLEAYRAHLADQGLTSTEIETELEALRRGGKRQEVELWNQVLTAEQPRFNTAPNSFLVRMTEGVEPGTALDVGMGQGRNAIFLAQEGWKVTGFDPAEEAVALAQELADKAGVEIATVIQGSEEFAWDADRWDLIVLSYVMVRPHIGQIKQALRSGGMVVLEAFHQDATQNQSIGRGVVYESNELLDLFSDFRIIQYEDTVATADFGRRETRVVRLCAMKP
ncbi:MAG: class I SAM-dependent methyltransferase [Acidobacteriota bacterium]|nr:MAG: class I SAM-dependent methyltransferase [Acidobacteriota bacterium]